VEQFLVSLRSIEEKGPKNKEFPFASDDPNRFFHWARDCGVGHSPILVDLRTLAAGCRRGCYSLQPTARGLPAISYYTRITLRHFTLQYSMDEGWYIGRFKEVPVVYSQGETLAALEENIRDAYQLVQEDAQELQAAQNTDENNWS
jgi:predicted RNase H-like HicB family nuclease